MAKESIKLIANNKKAYHDYFIEETTTIGYDYSGWNATTIARPY